MDKDNCDYFDITDDNIPIDHNNGFIVMQLNIHGLLNKQTELLNLINKITGTSKLDIIMLQEMWLTNTNCNLVNIPGYKHIFIHRTGKHGGGVSLLINSEFTCRKCDDLCINEPFLECCTVEMKLPNNKVFVSSVYRPPNTKESKFNNEIDKLLKSISRCSSLSLKGLDHNLDLLKSDIHKPTQIFLETVLSTSYIPCITRPTQITKSSATLIDNILVSCDIYNNINSGIAISDLSDHLPCIMTCPLMNHFQKGSIRIHKKKLDEKNFENIAHDLKIDWGFWNKIYQLTNATSYFITI